MSSLPNRRPKSAWRHDRPWIQKPREGDEERTLPATVKGESGPHLPIEREWTAAQTLLRALLRAMETASKLVDNDELRGYSLKENGIDVRVHPRCHYRNLIQTSLCPKRTQEPDCYSPPEWNLSDDSRRAVEISRTDRYLGKKLREIERKSFACFHFSGRTETNGSGSGAQRIERQITNRRVTTMEETVKEEASKKTAAKGKQVPANRKAATKEEAGKSACRWMGR